MKLEDLIVVYPNFISKEDCEKMIEWFNTNTDLHDNGKVGNDKSVEHCPEFKKSTQAYPLPNDPISDLITQIIFSAYKVYCQEYPSPSIDRKICLKDYSIRIYQKNHGHFLTHTDQGSDATVTRIFAAILYLNDVFDGGETEFPDQNILVKPEQGKVLIFPCNYLFPHSGNMPISNDKYITTAFINYLPDKDLKT
jgi:hypothetical protein